MQQYRCARYAMTWLTNLHIRGKILAVTLTMCLVTLVVGLVGYRSVEQTTSDLDSLGTVLVPKVQASGRMHQAMYEAVAELRGAALATDPADAQDFTEGARTAMLETTQAFVLYQSLVLSADEKRIL